jgi:hypothetical protein
MLSHFHPLPCLGQASSFTTRTTEYVTARERYILKYDPFAFVHADSSVLGSKLGSIEITDQHERTRSAYAVFVVHLDLYRFSGQSIQMMLVQGQK